MNHEQAKWEELRAAAEFVAWCWEHGPAGVTPGAMDRLNRALRALEDA
jgi:hypothetical protein